MASLRDILNRARWKDSGLHALEIHVLHRGAPGDRRVIGGSRVQSVRSAGIELTPDNEESDAVFVPYHRFLAVVGPDGAELWSKEGGHATPRAGAAAAMLADVRAGAEAPGVPGGEGTEVVIDIPVVLREAEGDAPLVIDGSAGEGGGQMLRSSLALSMATGRPFVLEKIRAGRKKPGLMRQHLTAVKAAALLSGAAVEGAELGSTRVTFRPGELSSGDHTVDVGSAGSALLVLQTIALPLALSAHPNRVKIRGGTHAQWAPPYPFIEQAWLPLVRRMGARVDVELTATGFYPAGGGEIILVTQPSDKLAPLHLGESSGVLAPLEAKAIVSQIPEGVARREIAAAAELLGDAPLVPRSETVKSAGPGNAMWLVARDEGTGTTNVFSGIGDVGVRAEDVGRAVAKSFLAWRESGASVEEHLADQVMLPIALAGAGSFTTNELTLHARTNIEVIRAFTGLRLRAWDLGGSRYRVALAPNQGA